MKNITIYSLSLLFLSASIFSGCTSVKNANNTQKGAAIGVAGGAVLGGMGWGEEESGGRGLTPAAGQ